MKKSFKYLLIIFTSLFLIIGLSSNSKNKPYNMFGYYISVVVSRSMEETIMKDDFIVYKQFNEYNKDDIIVFKIENYLVVHRIIEVTEFGYITKGDNNHSDDLSRYGYIQEKQIVGKVTHNFHLFGIGKFLIPNLN